VWVRLKIRASRCWSTSVSVAPIVIPPIVMGAGLAALQKNSGAGLQSLLFNSSLTGSTPFYVILALPFAYRSLDVGVRRSTCARWSMPTEPRRRMVHADRAVILPNVRTAVLTAADRFRSRSCFAEVVDRPGPALYDHLPGGARNQARRTPASPSRVRPTLLITWRCSSSHHIPRQPRLARAGLGGSYDRSRRPPRTPDASLRRARPRSTSSTSSRGGPRW